jgi:hypothetical protein
MDYDPLLCDPLNQFKIHASSNYEEIQRSTIYVAYC